MRSASGATYCFDPGALCLEFATTGGEGPRQKWETLHGPDDLAGWFRKSGLAGGSKLAEVRVRVTSREFEDARRLREAIWLTAAQLAHAKRPRSGDLTVLNELAARAPLTPRVDVAGPRRLWATPVSGSQILSTLARDAIELFTGKSAGRIRECAGTRCSLLFVDLSRPGRRRWCSMDHCGNWEKVRAFRARQRV